MNYANLLSRVMQARWFRANGFPHPEPMSLALSVTSRCMMKCRTCNVTANGEDELSVEEYGKIFRSMRERPLWVTITGGEPFLREDLPEIVGELYRYAQPEFVTLPTNGYLEEVVPRVVGKIARAAPKTRFVIHVSVDGIGRMHDELRGISDSFDRAMYTFARLKNLRLPNVLTGIHTTISRYNAERVKDVVRYIREFGPDVHHFEPAWPRAELNMQESDIAPTREQFETALESIESALATAPVDQWIVTKGIARTLRREYYRAVLRALAEERQVVPCYAGIASAHLATDGTLWACCTRGESLGNLREAGYGFRRVWTSKQADETREKIFNGECWCVMANAMHMSLLCDMAMSGRLMLRMLLRDKQG